MSTLATLTSAIRVGLVILSVGVTIVTVLYLASMPPPPPGSDGFAHGMAGFIGGGLILLSLGMATLAIVSPTLLGRDDPLGFNRWQRRALKGAGGLILLGIVVALIAGLEGIFLLIGLVMLAFGIVCAMLLWRFGEVLRGRRTRAEVAD